MSMRKESRESSFNGTIKPNHKADFLSIIILFKLQPHFNIASSVALVNTFAPLFYLNVG